MDAYSARARMVLFPVIPHDEPSPDAQEFESAVLTLWPCFLRQFSIIWRIAAAFPGAAPKKPDVSNLGEFLAAPCVRWKWRLGPENTMVPGEGWCGRVAPTSICPSRAADLVLKRGSEKFLY